MPLFNRQIVALIGPYNQPGFKIEGLAMSFKIKKTATQSANTLTLSINNLSETSRAKIKELDYHVILSAGYADDVGPEVVFTGDVTRVTNVYQPPLIITKLECGDGQRMLREVRISVSFGGPVAVSQILDAIAQKLQISVQIYTDIPAYNFDNGFAFVGPAREAMDKVCDKLGLEWSIQNNELQILPQRGVVQAKAISITPSTGLIGSPERLNDLDNQLIAIAKKPGWKVKSLLNPKILPGGVMYLESKDAKGFYRIESVEHEGENWGQTWTSTSEITEI